MLDRHAGRSRLLPADVRPPGRARCAARRHPARVKIDLFPEYIRNLPPEKRALWDIVGRLLCSRSGEGPHSCGGWRAQPLARRFGEVAMYPVPILTRDVPGYRHPSAHRYPLEGHHRAALSARADASASHVGTIFHAQLADGSRPKHTHDEVSPNSGYAFAVGDDDAWHSADPVGTEVTTRTRSCSPISLTPARCASCAIAASGWATGRSTSCATRFWR